MRWLVAITLAVSDISYADHWLQFTPCGYTIPEGREMLQMEVAPNIPAIMIRKAAIIGIYKQKPQTDPICTILLLQGNRIQPVLGSYDETVRKIRGQ